MFSYDKLLEQCLLDIQFKEGSGSPNDSAKPHHPITALNSPTWEQLSSRKNVLDFDDLAIQALQILGADSGDLEFTTEDYTFLFWFNQDNWIGGTAMFISRTSGGTNGYHCDFRLNKIRYITGDAGGSRFTESSSFLDDTWYLGAIVRSGTNVGIYINGVYDVESKGVHADHGSITTTFFIGRDNSSSTRYDGKCGSFRCWDKALTKEEIRLIFERERHLYGV